MASIHDLNRAIEESPEIPACTNAPDLFFPELGEGGRSEVRAAKKLCESCPIRLTCLEYALDAGEVWGIWGGLNYNERQALKRKRL